MVKTLRVLPMLLSECRTDLIRVAILLALDRCLSIPVVRLPSFPEIRQCGDLGTNGTRTTQIRVGMTRYRNTYRYVPTLRNILVEELLVRPATIRPMIVVKSRLRTTVSRWKETRCLWTCVGETLVMHFGVMAAVVLKFTLLMTW